MFPQASDSLPRALPHDAGPVSIWLYAASAELDGVVTGTAPSEVVEPAQSASKLRATKIPFFAEVSFNVGEEVSYMIVAAVSWFCPHPKQPLLGKPAEVWCHDKLEHPGIHLYIPVEKIASRCAHRTRIIDSDSDSDSPC